MIPALASIPNRASTPRPQSSPPPPVASAALPRETASLGKKALHALAGGATGALVGAAPGVALLLGDLAFGDPNGPGHPNTATMLFIYGVLATATGAAIGGVSGAVIGWRRA